LPDYFRGSAAVTLRMEDAPTPGSPPIELRYVAAWPERNGISIALADKPIRCPGIHQDAGTILTLRLTPDLDGHFYAGREVSARYEYASPLRSSTASRSTVAVNVQPFEAKKGAAIHAQVRVDTRMKLATERRLTGGGSFDAILCEYAHDGPERRPDTTPLADYAVGWRPPARADRDLGGRVLGAPFAPRSVVARVGTSHDGKKELRSVAFFDAETSDCSYPPGRPTTLTVTTFGSVAGPTAAAIPAGAHATGPGEPKTLDPDHGIAALEVSRFDDAVEGHVTGWSANLKAERDTEVSGRFRARICPE
jgi:hypothetical protein